MKRPVSVPEGAVYNEADKEWLLGETNENNQRIGPWKKWHTDGYLWETIDYREGIPPYPTQRFHPDGTLSQAGEWYGGDKYIGPLRLIKSDNPTPEYFPPDNAANVWAAEFDYEDEFIYNAQRYFDKDNNEVSSDGDLLPARPANVPARAHFIRAAYSSTNWVMGTVDTRIADYIGEYYEWDLDGKPVVKRLYSASGKVLEEYKYTDGVLRTSNVYDKDVPKDSETCYYYSGTAAPVVKTRIVYRHQGKDVTNTYFDKTGRQLYSVRREELSPVHKRRYFNGELVCEGHLSEEDFCFPESAVYYASGGGKLIDFTNNGDGTGTWRLYDATGEVVRQLTVTEKEDDHFRLIGWAAFMPSWGGYDAHTADTDWESVEYFFNRYYDELNAKLKLHALEVPAYLQKELDIVNWETIGAYHSDGGTELPIAINGLLSDDEKVVEVAEKMLWPEIEQQGVVYEATYKVAAILARMVPHYPHLPAVQLRLVKFLYDILDLPYITEQTDLYKELLGAVAPLEPMLLQWAVGSDTDMARIAQYILMYAGQEATEQFLLEESRNTSYSSTRRGYAVYSLSGFYLNKDQRDRLLTSFSAALGAEGDAFVRFVLAAQLVLLTGAEAEDAWLTELLHALADHEALDHDFGNMMPFIGNIDNAHEYILAVLRQSRPDVLEKNILPIIEALPAADSFKQISYLQTIFAVLFSDEAALEDMTPVRKKALLAAADAAAKSPGFVNLLEVFREYGLPHDAYALRQLAEA
ncbi:hypothetical protein HGH92_31930 [Chitinophaga varians]|uniref:Uncharacterized protein n=1 Tax=Chitinophaga varians TaxID=2202339 RepID=A0A847S6D1_9BACT|nr:hypothetical protein [Chitinophaga varians]NLR68955.1 hypothetical protein [Chitinophaga varians]